MQVREKKKKLQKQTKKIYYSMSPPQTANHIMAPKCKWPGKTSKELKRIITTMFKQLKDMNILQKNKNKDMNEMQKSA